MNRTVRVIFCDNEHGTGDVTFPQISRLTEQDFIQPQTAKELRKAAKKEGWGMANGQDYCDLCIGDMRP